ncbi:hypothetical protein D9613_011692 [Agrocybe pediades]|uniref:Uncharacterized protein n=1 Tax=Agrocybe pediades TaxID=84607 RepID=A0A8H4VS53_9AGAR|nr:hypothetical protein D9613_011692 [Agrocybe pediades]
MALPFSSLYGANLVAVIVASWLVYILPTARDTIYGIGLYMSLNYFKTSYGKDAYILQAMVLALCILSTLEIAFSGHQVYFFLIICHDNPQMLKIMPFSVLVCVFISPPD